MRNFNFLYGFNIKLSNHFNSNSDGVLNYAFFKKNPLVLSPEKNDSFNEFINRLNDILDILFNIFNRPYIETKVYEVIKRNELVSNFSNDSFAKTVKDASLWKEYNKKMRPELVYSIEYDDSFINYENTFIIYAFKQIINLVSTLKEFNIESTNSLKSFYGTNEASLSKLSVYKSLNEDKDIVSKYIYVDGENNQNYENLLKIHSKIKHLKLHKFYRVLKDHQFKLPINLTNTILHDIRYNKVYRFCKDNLLISNTLFDFDTAFYNYTVFRIFNFLTESKKVKTLKIKELTFNKNKIGINEEVSFIYNSIEYLLSLDPLNNALILKTTIGNETNETLIKTIYSYNNELFDSFNYDNLIIYTNNNLSKNFSNIVELNFEKDMFDDSLIENTLISTQILIPYLKDKITKCPYCGKEHLTKESNHYHCLDCNGEFKLINKNEKNFIRIKNLWRNY